MCNVWGLVNVCGLWCNLTACKTCLNANLNKYWSLKHNFWSSALLIRLFSLSKTFLWTQMSKTKRSIPVTHKSLTACGRIAWHAQITSHALVGFGHKFHAASFAQIHKCKLLIYWFSLFVQRKRAVLNKQNSLWPSTRNRVNNYRNYSLACDS